jgi:hypothetical protein
MTQTLKWVRRTDPQITQFREGGPWPTFRIAAGPFGFEPYVNGSDGGLKPTLIWNDLCQRARGED